MVSLSGTKGVSKANTQRPEPQHSQQSSSSALDFQMAKEKAIQEATEAWDGENTDELEDDIIWRLKHYLGGGTTTS